jgi:glutaredoxin-like protein NrdH
MSIIVYSNPNCVQCEQTKRYLISNGVEFQIKMIEESPEVKAIIDANDYKAAPVVVAGDVSWSGFKYDKLSALVRAAA